MFLGKRMFAKNPIVVYYNERKIGKKGELAAGEGGGEKASKHKNASFKENVSLIDF